MPEEFKGGIFVILFIFGTLFLCLVCSIAFEYGKNFGIAEVQGQAVEREYATWEGKDATFTWRENDSKKIQKLNE